MKPTRKSSLFSDERRLTLAAGLVLLSLFSLALVTLLLLRRSVLDGIQDSQSFAAHLAGKQVSALIETRLNNLKAYLELPQFRRSILAGDVDGMSARLRLLAEHDPYIERATITDARGRYVCSVPPSKNARGTDLSDMDWYRGTVAGKGPFVSQVFQRRLPPQHLVVALAAPLAIQGETRALLATLLDLKALAGLTIEPHKGAGRKAILLDPAGQIVGDAEREGGPDTSLASLAIVREGLAGRASQGRYIDPVSGLRQMGSVEPLTLSGRHWALLVQQPEAELLAPLHRLYWRMGAFSLLALLLAASGLGVLIRARRRAAELALTLEQQNEELGLQSEELEQANEELQQQSDELQQQSEELALQNDELEQLNGELEGLRKGLETTVAQRTEELKAKEAEFVQAQKLEAVGRLAGGVAHDFNNLLTVVLGYVDLLKKSPNDTALREQGLKEIGLAGERGSRLTHQLLAFARRQMVDPRPIDLAALVDGLLPMLRRLMEASIEIRSSHQKTDLRVMADSTQIEQVLMNLCVNARDALPKGGKIDISTESVELSEPLGDGDARLPAGRYLLLQVQDNGHGMPPEVLKQAFEPFFTTKEVGRGSGLGLSMVYGAVRQAHGQVFAFSQPDHGTVFKLYFPAITAQGAPASVSESALPSRGHERILLAEDNLPLRAMAARSLQQFGYQVVEAADGTEALWKLRQDGGPFDLLVSDLVMPGGSGLELARMASAERPGLRVLFISGYSDVELPGPGEKLRWAFLAKPFNTATLLNKVRACLDGDKPA